MSKYYSPSLDGFYDDGIHSELPSDAVAITDEEHQELLMGQQKGGSIKADKKGKPYLVPPIADDLETVKFKASNRIKAKARQAIVDLDSEYTTPEIEMFGLQETEARRWLADKDAATPVLDEMLDTESGETMKELAEAVIRKADERTTLRTQTVAKMRRLLRKIESAENEDDAKAVTWEAK